MAKVEVFKNRLTKAQEELVKALDAEKAKKKVLSEIENGKGTQFDPIVADALLELIRRNEIVLHE